MNTSLTRRDFMTSISAGCGATLLLPADTWSAERSLPSFSFCLVSDTHLGRKDDLAAEKLWRRAAAEIAAGPGDFVLHLGDVVDGGREAQYPKYKEIRDSIKKPMHEVPGNHDPPELFEKHLRRPINMRFDHQGVRFLLFNNSRTDLHLGFITPEQIAWLSSEFDDAAKQNLLVVLCAHVPVHHNLHPDRGWYVKPEDGQTALYALLAKHRDRALALLHGHFHNGVRGWDDHKPLHEVSIPSVCYNQTRNLPERDATGYNLPEFRAGYILAEFTKQGLALRYKPIGADAALAHECPLPQLGG